MNSEFQFEDRASSRRSKHEGESSSSLCDRLSRTRDFSQRQLPTDQDYAVSTREYQTDQSSLLPAPAAAGPVLEQRQKQRQQQKPPHRCAEVDGSLHIREPLNKFKLCQSSTGVAAPRRDETVSDFAKPPTCQPANPAQRGPTRYSKTRVAVPRKRHAKWLFPFRGPHGQVFVRGVEVKATSHTPCWGTFTLDLL